MLKKLAAKAMLGLATAIVFGDPTIGTDIADDV